MIKYCEGMPQKELFEICGKDAVGTEIISDFTLYGEKSHIYDSFFWIQNDSLALSKRGSLLRITGEISEREELISFIDFISPDFILTSENIGSKLPFDIIERGQVLSLFTSEDKSSQNIPDTDFSLNKLAEFFKRTEMIKNKDAFMLDFSFALSRNAAFYEIIRDEKKEIIAAAVAASVTDKSAVIDIVAVDKNYRRKGLGTKLLNALLGRLNNKTVYIFKETDKNTEFYKKSGFEFNENFVTLKVK